MTLTTRKKIIIGSLVTIFLAALATAALEWVDISQTDLPVLGEVPEFTMTDQNGISFGRQDMLGHINVADFFFTSSPDVCPVMNANMAELYHSYERTNKIRFISISIDPDRDSLEALRKYAKGWGVGDDRWVFLRAPLESIVRLGSDSFMLPSDSTPAGNSTRLILIDDQARIRGYYNGMEAVSMKILRNHIRLLAREPR